MTAIYWNYWFFMRLAKKNKRTKCSRIPSQFYMYILYMTIISKLYSNPLHVLCMHNLCYYAYISKIVIIWQFVKVILLFEIRKYMGSTSTYENFLFIPPSVYDEKRVRFRALYRNIRNSRKRILLKVLQFFSAISLNY